MIDQANHLRRLVMQSADQPASASAELPKTVLVAGGKGGAGTTTVAVNLAVSLARRGIRTILVDADPDGADVQNICRLRQRYTIADVLGGRRTLGEALQTGPAGVMILPGAWAVTDLADASERSRERLLAQIAGSGSRADVVVIDGGNGLHAITRRFWRACEEVVLVSTAESSAVLDTYAVLKAALGPEPRARVHLLVNRCDGKDQSAEVHGRIGRSTQRFLGFKLSSCHWMPEDENVVAAGRQAVPFALSRTAAKAAESVSVLAEQLRGSSDGLLAKSCEDREGGRIETSANNLRNRLNPGDENVDTEEDRRFLTQC